MRNRPVMFLVVFVCSLLFSSVSRADTSAQEQPQVFTNQDLGKYNTPSGPGKKDSATVFQEDRDESLKYKKKRITEEREQEYWCKKASDYKKKIEKGNEDVKGMEKELSAEKNKGVSTGKKNAQLQKRLSKARKLVKDAEAGLDALEHEAHRKGVPPGWLRCQT